MKNYKAEARKFSEILKTNFIPHKLVENFNRSSIVFNWSTTSLIFADAANIGDNNVVMVLEDKNNKGKYIYYQLEKDEMICKTISQYHQITTNKLNKFIEEKLNDCNYALDENELVPASRDDFEEVSRKGYCLTANNDIFTLHYYDSKAMDEREEYIEIARAYTDSNPMYNRYYINRRYL